MTNHAAPPPYKRAPSIDKSTWYKGILISNLATEKDTGGEFEFVVTKMRKGTEPPPHMHEREHEFFYVLEGILDVYVEDEYFRAKAGECVFLPKRKAHAFRIGSPEIHMLVLMTPGGFMNAASIMAIPAQGLDIPPDDGVTYSTVDLSETMRARPWSRKPTGAASLPEETTLRAGGPCLSSGLGGWHSAMIRKRNRLSWSRGVESQLSATRNVNGLLTSRALIR